MTRYRYILQTGFDSVAWIIGLAVASYLRLEFDLGAVPVAAVLGIGALAVVFQVGVGTRAGLYVHRWRYGTFDEVTSTVKIVLLTTVVITAVNLTPAVDRALPVSVTIMGGFLALFVMGFGRMAWRIQMDTWTRVTDDREPIIVVGAGEGGLRIITSMLQAGPYHPAALLDDNPDLQNLRVRGVAVAGTSADMAAVASATGATKLVIAIPSASGEAIREITAHADARGLDIFVLPPVADLLAGGALQDMRPLTEEDLLGRREINLDIDGVAGYLTGKRVLVTGAGGSIGSELCRQINRYAPETLVMLDRDESALQAVQVSIEGRGLLDRRDLVVCCIRDCDRLDEVFAEHRPQVIFHAAALKHLPLLEMYPEEGWKSNVWGTQNLLELSGRYGVERFVNISTDKAADPTSVLGHTKRLAEQLTAHAGRSGAGTYLSVRFGNVLGSRGSVLPLFRAQIAAGGPVTVTHPDVTRFFMTIPEACELVIQAGALGEGGEVLVLDMGEPVRIADLARRLVAESDRDVDLVFTGLRGGEKLEEALFGADEDPVPSGHDLIARVDVPPLTPEMAEALDPFRAAPVIELRDRAAKPVDQRVKRSV